MNLAKLERPMHECEQFPGMSVLDHGMDVHARYLDLISNSPKLRWRLPDWVDALKPLQLPLDVMRLYQIYHDCGKPFCRVVDDEGKQHFPNHAQVSYDTWMRYADTPEDGQVGELIRMDMLAHTVKGEAIDTFIQHPEAPSLLLTALAEIHSNAGWLGQLDSDQFKIKWKQLDKIGKRMVAKG
jgi:hypothetical protein